MGESTGSPMWRYSRLPQCSRFLSRRSVEEEDKFATRNIIRHLGRELLRRDHLDVGIVTVNLFEFVSYPTSDSVVAPPQVSVTDDQGPRHFKVSKVRELPNSAAENHPRGSSFPLTIHILFSESRMCVVSRCEVIARLEAGDQQILGNCSPLGMSTMRSVPNRVFMVTMPADPVNTRPIRTASSLTANLRRMLIARSASRLRNKRYKAAFIGEIQWIEPEHDLLC